MSAKIQNCQWLFERREELVQLYRAHKEFPYDVSPATVQRYFRRGVSTPNGHFKLETAVSGNKRFTSREAIERFLRAQQGESDPQSNIGAVPTSGGMSKRELKSEMQRLGLRPQGEQPQADSPVEKPQGKRKPVARTPLNRKGGGL
jgi:hypothetical protein